MIQDANRDWLNKEEAEAFIGQGSYFYLHKWGSHSDNKLKGWNWAAMFLGVTWLAYRRMYREAFLYTLIILVVTFCIDFLLLISLSFQLPNEITRQFTYLFFGICGNAIYRKKAIRVFRESRHMNHTERIACLQQNGGVSIGGAIGFTVLLFVAVFIVVFAIVWLTNDSSYQATFY